LLLFIEVNGMAHVILTVSRFEVSREFYRKLLPEFGMKPVFDGRSWDELHLDRQRSP
jgi:catechol 2,3-dioxygenase-like lactoylglutathione lyase family enzyme